MTVRRLHSRSASSSRTVRSIGRSAKRRCCGACRSSTADRCQPQRWHVCSRRSCPPAAPSRTRSRLPFSAPAVRFRKKPRSSISAAARARSRPVRSTRYFARSKPAPRATGWSRSRTPPRARSDERSISCWRRRSGSAARSCCPCTSVCSRSAMLPWRASIPTRRAWPSATTGSSRISPASSAFPW